MQDFEGSVLSLFSEKLRREVAQLDEQILRGVPDWDEYLRRTSHREGLLRAGALAQEAMKAAEKGE